MSELKKELQMGFTHEHFPESCHICLIYENEQQRQKIVSEYIAAGIRQGEVVRYFTDQTMPESVRSWLLELGVELSEVEKNGSFGISIAENAYCPDGKFDPQKMIDRAVQRYGIAQKAGYTGSRACGEMSWALKDIPGSDRLLEYEVLLNTITSSFPHNGMCQYDARLFDGATLFKVLQVHPYIIAQGQIVRNPYYIKPEEFMAEKK
ncbi:MAG: MEDS domain-containing protein [Bacteroidales bacterium]|nr:MEDS domain-containing protein [Bacteroidales bacterium]